MLLKQGNQLIVNAHRRQYLKTIKERFEAKIIEHRDIAWKLMDRVCGDAQNEIGSLWMWLADITYHDWQQYHGLQDMSNTIKQRIHVAGGGSHFDVMAELQLNAEAQINAAAKEAATKLSELKETGREKIILGDATENFEKNWIQAQVKSAAEDVETVVSKATQGTETPEPIVDQTPDGVEKATEETSDDAESSVAEINEAIYETPHVVAESIWDEGTVNENFPIHVNTASSVEETSTATLGTSQGVGDSIASEISTASLGTSQGPGESIAVQTTSAIGEGRLSASNHLNDVGNDASSFADQTEHGASLVSPLAGEALESGPIAVSSGSSSSTKGIVNPKGRVQKVFQVPEPELDEKTAFTASNPLYGTEPDMAKKGTDGATSLDEQVTINANNVSPGNGPSVSEKATDSVIGVGEKSASNISESIHGTGSEIIEKAPIAASSVLSESSESIIGTETEPMGKATPAVGNIVDNVISGVEAVVGDVSSLHSGVASEVSEVHVDTPSNSGE